MTKIDVNGYNIPSGRGRIAIYAGVDYIQKQGGSAPMKDVLEHMVQVSGLNRSTAGWLTSPNSKRSPVAAIFQRNKGRNPKTGLNIFHMNVTPGAEHLSNLLASALAEEKTRREERLEAARVERFNTCKAGLEKIGAKIGDLVTYKSLSFGHDKGPFILLGVDDAGIINTRGPNGNHYILHYDVDTLTKV